MTTPKATGWPRLSVDLPDRRHPQRCQACGATGTAVDRWREHDDADRPEPIVVVLCRACGDQLIDPHPRLYARLDPNEPVPGCMAICVDCRWREGVRCTHPRAKANGGPGVVLTIATPMHAFVCRRGKGARSGPMTIWPSPATACQQKEVADG